MVGLEAALDDRAHVDRYVAEVRRSRQMLYEACDRWGVRYWESEANFVLVRIGSRADAIVDRLAERHIFVRNRSSEPGCDGCIRITAGRIQDTRACIAALDAFMETEDESCAAR